MSKVITFSVASLFLYTPSETPDIPPARARQEAEFGQTKRACLHWLFGTQEN